MADKNMEQRFEEWAGNKPVEFADMDKDPVSFWCWKAWQKAAEIEREACASVCENQTEGFAATSTWDEAALACARAIRARKVGAGDTAVQGDMLLPANVKHDRRTAALSPSVRVDGPVGPHTQEE